ncbi:hypothetical protein Tco_1491619 [Tanacetum coccineum]
MYVCLLMSGKSGNLVIIHIGKCAFATDYDYALDVLIYLMADESDKNDDIKKKKLSLEQQGAHKSLLNMFQDRNCHLGMAMVIDDRLKILENVDWHEQFPFRDEDFQRFDESSDLVFYESPRFVTHIDDPTIVALTKYYKEVFPPSNTPSVALLDMCSSWISYFPPDISKNV